MQPLNFVEIVASKVTDLQISELLYALHALNCTVNYGKLGDLVGVMAHLDLGNSFAWALQMVLPSLQAHLNFINSII